MCFTSRLFESIFYFSRQKKIIKASEGERRQGYHHRWNNLFLVCSLMPPLYTREDQTFVECVNKFICVTSHNQPCGKLRVILVWNDVVHERTSKRQSGCMDGLILIKTKTALCVCQRTQVSTHFSALFCLFVIIKLI